MRLELKLVRDDGTVLITSETVLNSPVCPTEEVGIQLDAPIFDDRARHLALSRLSVKFSWFDFQKEARPGVELQADPEREARMADATGIFVRAKTSAGKWDSLDIGTLNRDSLHAWLRSGGGVNPYAENVVLLLLGHEAING